MFALRIAETGYIFSSFTSLFDKSQPLSKQSDLSSSLQDHHLALAALERRRRRRCRCAASANLGCVVSLPFLFSRT